MKLLELKVKRRWFAEDYTIGTFFADGERVCDTIEDKNRDLNRDGDLNDKGEGKVYGETAIPFGRYEVVLNISPKFKRRLPRLLNVKHFEGILIHRGNTVKDTHGCIIVGENKVKGKVINSTFYEKKVVEICEQAIEEGKRIFITIE